MGRSLKDLVREFCGRTNIPRPSTVSGSTDPQIVQIMGLLNEELDESVSRENFAWLQRECVFNASSVEFQGLLSDLLPDNDTMWKVVPGTFFNRTTHLVCEGPISEQEWQQYKALQAGMLPRFRFWQEGLYLQPAPTAGDLYAFEYLSQQCVKSAGGGYKRYFDNDDDTCVIDDSVLLAALRWRWKSEKGLDYSEDFSRYERIRASYTMTTGLKPKIDLAGERNVQGPGIIVPPGSWVVPH